MFSVVLTPNSRWRARLLGGLALAAVAGGAVSALIPPRLGPEPVVMAVKASAYNSTPRQTDAQPFVGACGVRLRPDQKSIAVSRDLFRGPLPCGAKVWIDELRDEFVVLDTMHRRWRAKIDIYMGLDVAAARRWGVREVTIRWIPEPEVRP